MNGLPPYGELLRIRVVNEGGGVRLVMPFHDDVLGRPGFLHGGAIAGLLELAGYAALREAIDDADVRLKPVTITVDFLRGGTELETWAEGRVKRLGRRVANVEVAAWQEDEARPIATARMNVMVRRGGQSGS